MLSVPEHVVRQSPLYLAVSQQLQMAMADADTFRNMFSQMQRTVGALEQEKREEREKASVMLLLKRIVLCGLFKYGVASYLILYTSPESRGIAKAGTRERD